MSTSASQVVVRRKSLNAAPSPSERSCSICGSTSSKGGTSAEDTRIRWEPNCVSTGSVTSPTSASNAASRKTGSNCVWRVMQSRLPPSAAEVVSSLAAEEASSVKSAPAWICAYRSAASAAAASGVLSPAPPSAVPTSRWARHRVSNSAWFSS